MKLQQLGIMAMAAIALIACNEKEQPSNMQINPASAMMNYADSIQLTVEGEDGPFVWSSDNLYNAIVDTATGMVYGNHIGSTTIRAKKGDKEATCSITVNPKSKLYDDPCIGWDKSVAAVKAAIGGTPTLENDSVLIYTIGANQDILLQYVFQNDKLYAICAYLTTSYSNELAQYLNERYQYFGAQSNVYYFFDAMDYKKASMQVSLSAVSISSTTLLQVIYLKMEAQSAPMRKVAMPLVGM